MSEKFSLHPRLAADTQLLGEFPLTQVLLMNDQQFPWLILVPKVAQLTEIHQLGAEQGQQLWREVEAVSQALELEFTADKMNFAALGNQVPQLHLHLLVRYTTDVAWPHPVWGRQPIQPYTKVEFDLMQTHMNCCLSRLEIPFQAAN